MEDWALQIVNAYTAGEKSELNRYRVLMFMKISISESLEEFANIEHYYIVSRALFYAIGDMNKTVVTYPKVVAVAFYCLLRCIQQEEQAQNSDIKSDHDFAVSSALAFILMAENSKLIQEKILLPILENNIDATLRLYFSLLGTFYWDYKTAYVIESFDENVRVRLKAAVENNSGLKGIAERTKVLMKQMVNNYMDVLIGNYSTKVFKNLV